MAAKRRLRARARAHWAKLGGKSRSTLSVGIAAALRDVATVVEQLTGRAAVIGGIAVIARGVPRLTRDIAIATAGADLSVATLAGELSNVGIELRISELGDALEVTPFGEWPMRKLIGTALFVEAIEGWAPRGRRVDWDRCEEN